MATHTLRFPQIDLSSVLAQQNPHIDLRLEAYEQSTRNFLKAVVQSKNRAISAISERRTNQAAEKKKIVERTQAFETEINGCKIKEIELMADLEREREEKKEVESAVAAFKRQLASLRDKSAAINAEIEQHKAIVANLERERNKEQSILHKHASVVSPEREAYEYRLSCVVEGIEKDQLLVRFTNLDPQNPEREFSFVLDVSDRIYKVLTSSPHLPVLPILVDRLNESSDVYLFIKQVRSGYLDVLTVT